MKRSVTEKNEHFYETKSFAKNEWERENQKVYNKIENLCFFSASRRIFSFLYNIFSLVWLQKIIKKAFREGEREKKSFLNGSLNSHTQGCGWYIVFSCFLFRQILKMKRKTQLHANDNKIIFMDFSISLLSVPPFEESNVHVTFLNYYRCNNAVSLCGFFDVLHLVMVYSLSNLSLDNNSWDMHMSISKMFDTLFK